MKNLNLKKLQAVINARRINDMAIHRNKYLTLCFNNWGEIFENLAKICLFDNIELQKHWGSECVTKIYDILLDVELKDDNKAQNKKRKAFNTDFIEVRMGKRYEEYSYKKKHVWFEKAIEDEGFDIRDFDIETVVENNRERMIRFFERLKVIPYTITRDNLIDLMNKFIYNE